MTPEEFTRMLQQKQEEITRFIEQDLPATVGEVAVDHFKENFALEGFVDDSLQKWPEVKRRLNPRTRGVRKMNKILHQEGHLHESITFDKEPGRVIISANPQNEGAAHNYAAAHNEGTTTAGRGNRTTIPQRKFIGDSQKLDEKIRKEIEDGLDGILGK